MEKKTRIHTSSRQQQKQQIILTILLASISLAAMIFFILFVTGHMATPKNSDASPGLHGNKTVASGTVILNEYTYLTSDASAGNTQITVSGNSLNANSRFSGNLAAGELIMIIQMHGATISETNSSSYGSISNYNNSGKFEFAEVSGTSSTNKINLTSGLLKSYSVSGEVQVIRVPRYQNFTVNSGATVTSPAWNGTTGGIVAVEVNHVATIDGIIDVSGLGFRGGAIEQHASLPGDHSNWRSTDNDNGGEKGESIAGYQGDYGWGRYGRGAPANGGGGGNSHNAAGGGGANGNNGISWNGKGNPDNSNSNWTTAWNLESSGFSSNTSSGGGRGGYSWSNSNQNPLTLGVNNSTWSGDNRYNVGGYGGRPLDYSGGRIFMGGGGGAGDSNSNKGTDGADGGGIIYILCGQNVTGTGSLKANGNDAVTVTGPGSVWLDGPGGGGGGGTVIVYSKGGSVSSLSIEAKGGKGGDWYNTSATNENEGAGGGGGGGYISVTNPSGLTQSVAGGVQGDNRNSIMVNFKPNGGTKGAAGQISTNPPNPYTTSVALPVVLTSFTGKQIAEKISLQWTTATETNNKYFTIEKSNDGKNFSVAGRIDGSGNSSQKKEYTFNDTRPNKRINYYRLIQTDNNGKVITYQPIAIEMKEWNASSRSEALLFPNPFTDKCWLKLNYSGEHGSAQIRINDINGRLIHSKSVDLEKGTNIIEFNNLSDIHSGIYMMDIKPENDPAFSMKLIKN